MRTGAPFLLTFTILFGHALAAQTAPQTQPPASPPGTSAQAPSAQEQARQKIEEAAPTLNLTADQKAKLQPVIADEIQTVHDLQADTTMTREQKQAKFHDAITADRAKIDAILTPEQKQKLQQMHAQEQGQAQGASPATPAPNASPNPKP